MTIKEFSDRYYQPTWKKVNGLKINQISEQDRMIIAMGSSGIAIDNTQYKEYLQVMENLSIIENELYNPPTKQQLLQIIADQWKVNPNKLASNLKNLFSREEKKRKCKD